MITTTAWRAAFDSGREQARTARRDGTVPDDIEGVHDVSIARADALMRAWVKNVPARYAHACFDDLFPHQQPDVLRSWLASDSATLWIVGPTGVGKTHSAWALARTGARDLGLRSRGITHRDYLRSLQPGGSAEPAWKIRAAATDTDLLIIDDFGAETDTGTGSASVHTCGETHSLINARVQNRRRQILTTNLTPEVIRGLYGDRIYSRLSQDAVAVTMNHHLDLRMHRP